MDISTAKPSAEERARVPHHLLDIRAPDEEFSLALFHNLANEAIQDIHSRGHLPILVGGTGQYVWALLEGWRVPKVAPNPSLREDLEIQARQQGSWALYQGLQAVDPERAKKIDPKNVRRIIRALEVHYSAGKMPPQARGKEPTARPFLVIGLTTSRGELYHRIDARIDDMIAVGLVQEVRNLLEMDYSLDLPSMSGVGYQEIGAHLCGELTLEEAVQRIKYHTHRIARHQYAWFRLKDPRIHWIEAEGHQLDASLQMVQEFMARYDKMASSERA